MTETPIDDKSKEKKRQNDDNMNKEEQNNKKKKIVYFGRIHPHKNLHIVIKSFIKANLQKDWMLELYGIRDDEKYFIELNRLIKDCPQIRIMEPIFGEEKQKVKMNVFFLLFLLFA